MSINTNYWKLVTALAFSLLLCGCATVDDIRRASSLIQLDNDLTSILNNSKLTGTDEANARLEIIANDAEKNAQSNAEAGRDYEAIAFYRIAATARWQQQNETNTQAFVNSVNSALNLCSKLEGQDIAPDRDCLYLKLVLPFKAYERLALEVQDIELINFTNNIETDVEVVTLNDTYLKMEALYGLTARLYTLAPKDIINDHTGMKNYYCEETQRLYDFYKNKWITMEQQVAAFEQYKPQTSKEVRFQSDKVLLISIDELASKYAIIRGVCQE